jgi:outer membrane immunogenic protein
VLEACDIFCATPTVSASSSSFRNGWTFGGGLEAAIEGAWTAKIVYLYYDLGAVTLTTPAGTGIGANTWNVETDGSMVRAGINYRFNTFKWGY